MHRILANLSSLGTRVCLGFTVVASGCISADSGILDVAEGCDEFMPGESLPGGLELDGESKRFVQASADLTGAAIDIQVAVLEACSGVATDLGADNTWNDIDSDADAISNGDGTGACDAAIREVTDVLAEAGESNAALALLVSRGECHVDFSAQTACDADCTVHGSCDSGTVETRCEPGDLSVICEAECEASAACVGLPDRPCNCRGNCEANCDGECSGRCMGDDGRITDGGNCRGKCEASCRGRCTGRCEIAEPAGIECGASVRCTGGCSGVFRDPVCVSEYTPPSCEIDAACHASCSARVTAEAQCDPPSVEIFVDVEETPGLEPLIDVLEMHLPPLFEAAELRGRLVANAVDELGATGASIADNVENLSGKTLACVSVASASVAEALAGLSVSIEASVDLTVTVDERSL